MVVSISPTTVRQIRLRDLAGGEVDGDAERRRVRARDACHSTVCRQASSSTQRPSDSISAGLLADGNEVVGQDQAAPRVLPAHKCLDARRSHRSRARRSADSAGAARRGRSHGAARSRAGAARRPARASPGRTARSGHGRAPSRGTSRRRRPGSASAGRSPASRPSAIPMLAVTKCSTPFEHERPRERCTDALRDLDRVALVGDVLDQDPELVAAEAGDGVTRAQRLLEPRGDRRSAARRRRRDRGCR